MKTRNIHGGRGAASAVALLAMALAARAGDVTFFAYSDIHYGADGGGKHPPVVRSSKVEVINALPGTEYPAQVGGKVAVPRGIVMQGDLINDGAVAEKYPTQWANYIADFGVNGEGRCKFPVFEAIGNHDVNENLYVFNKIKERNQQRLKLKHISNVSSNGYHYSWDWDDVHFVNVNLFPGNVWEGEADAYGRGHNPMYARDFLVDDLRKNVGDSGRPVVVVQHFRPVDENWWTYAAADKYQRAIQDYNVIVIMVGHQGGGVNNVWRGINWVSSNGELIVCRITEDGFMAVGRGATSWGAPFQKKIFHSFAASGLPAVVNNGAWATGVTPTSATLSGKVVYSAAPETEVTAYWGTADGGKTASGWQNSRKLGSAKKGGECSAEITGLQPWTQYCYRCQGSNAKGDVWAAASVPFCTPGVLPEGWKTGMVGYEQRPGGGAHWDNGVFTVRGSGRDIGERGERSDNFQYAYRNMEGDGEFKAQIVTAETKSREPKMGIMLRESPEAGARQVSVLLMPKSGLRLASRKTADGASSLTILGEVKAAPCWVKLVRRGKVFSGFTSADGSAWTPVGEPLTIDMPATLCAGMAVTAGNRDESKLVTATFDQVSISDKAPTE